MDFWWFGGVVMLETTSRKSSWPPLQTLWEFPTAHTLDDFPLSVRVIRDPCVNLCFPTPAMSNRSLQGTLPPSFAPLLCEGRKRASRSAPPAGERSAVKAPSWDRWKQNAWVLDSTHWELTWNKNHRTDVTFKMIEICWHMFYSLYIYTYIYIHTYIYGIVYVLYCTVM